VSRRAEYGDRFVQQLIAALRKGFSSMNRVKRSLLGSTIVAGMALAITPAMAQDAQASPQSTPAPTTGSTDANATATSTASASAQPATDTSEIIVTGTMFRRTNSETPSPVTVLSAQRLKEAGITNISDAVRSISADNSGSIPTSFTNGFGAGSSGVALRGLTVNSTLVLVDGLRTANYGLSDDGQRAFVDLNSIPQATVDHIDVVKDGASSTYGADAIAGVVNIIMKQQVTGVQGTVEGGISQHKDGGEQRMTLTAGTGDLASKGWNIYASAEYERDSQIYNRDRGFPYNTADLTSIGGQDNNSGSVVPGATPNAIVAPTTGATAGNPFSGTGQTGQFQILNPAGCATGHAVTGDQGTGCEVNEVAKYDEIQPQQTRFGVSVHGAVQVNDTSQAYMMFSYFQNKVVTQTTPSSIREANPVNTLNTVLPAVLSDGRLNPNDPFAAAGEDAAIYYQFGDIPAGSTYLNHMLRAAAGIHGTFGDGWSYSADATAAHSWLDITQRGYLNIAQLESDINDGSYNFVDPSQNSAAVRSALSPNIHTQATTDEDMAQGSITKDLFQLPGGPLQLGVGGSVRYEAQNDPNANPDNTTLDLNAYTAVGHHTVESAYFEVNAPVLKQLEINASGRFDHYQEGYSHFSPKIGAKYTPIPQLAIRGTFSKGFRAPSFAETNGSVIGYTTTTIPCSAQAQHGATIAKDGSCSGGSAYNQAYSIGFNTSANPNLKPELSRSFTGGFVVQPVSWLSLTADYYNIKKTRVISGGPQANDALNAYYNGTALPAGYSVTLDSVDPQFPDAVRRVLYVNSPYANAAALKTDGIDLSAQAKFRVTDDIRLSSSIEVTDILHYKFKPAAGDPYEEYVGTQAPYITSSGAGTPKWRGNWQNTIEYGKVSLTGTAYYTSGYKAVAIDQFGGSDCASSATYQDGDFNCRVKRFVEVDLVGDYKVTDKFDFYFNVINLLNAGAPLNAGNYAATNYNPTYTQQGAIGRFFRVGANFKF
jgi:iron complex outermembrane receptor protein